jgi:hypothetical protein
MPKQQRLAVCEALLFESAWLKATGFVQKPAWVASMALVALAGGACGRLGSAHIPSRSA